MDLELKKQEVLDLLSNYFEFEVQESEDGEINLKVLSELQPTATQIESILCIIADTNFHVIKIDDFVGILIDMREPQIF